METLSRSARFTLAECAVIDEYLQRSNTTYTEEYRNILLPHSQEKLRNLKAQSAECSQEMSIDDEDDERLVDIIAQVPKILRESLEAHAEEFKITLHEAVEQAIGNYPADVQDDEDRFEMKTDRLSEGQ